MDRGGCRMEIFSHALMDSQDIGGHRLVFWGRERIHNPQTFFTIPNPPPPDLRGVEPPFESISHSWVIKVC